MPYNAEISRANPSCFLFLVDQSGSMQDVVAAADSLDAASKESKAQKLATAINRLLQNLVIRCSKGDVRDYYHLGVIGYRTGSSGRKIVGPAFTGALAGRELVPISEVANNAARIDQRTRKVEDGAGGLVDQPIRFPIWFDATAEGGTPMCEALNLAYSIISGWLSQHPDCFPPVVIHVTDGESTDGSPIEAMKSLTALSSSDGNVLLFNLHLSSNLAAKPVSFPASETSLPDEYAQALFNGSSPLTPYMCQCARTDHGLLLDEGARGFVLNADMTLIIQAIDIGTRAQNLR